MKFKLLNIVWMCIEDRWFVDFELGGHTFSSPIGKGCSNIFKWTGYPSFGFEQLVFGSSTKVWLTDSKGIIHKLSVNDEVDLPV